MALFVSPSLLAARRDPEFFQTVPLILAIDPAIDADAVSQKIADTWKIKIGSHIPSMNMFGLIAPAGVLDDIASIDAVTEMHLDHTQYAFSAPPFPNPFNALPQLLPMGDVGGVPSSFGPLTEVFQNPQIKLTEEGWIPTAESIKATNIPLLWEAGLDGSGVDVAVLDTGCDNNNPQLQGVVTKKSSMALFPSGDDENGHGTWCVTCIRGKSMRHYVNGLPMAGVAQKCNLTSWKVLGYGVGTGSTSDIMAAIDGAIADGNEILSMSLGSSGRADEETDPMVRQINNYGVTHPQVLFVVANGNSGPDPQTVGVPAVAENAISVGSWGLIDGAPAYFSSRGPSIQAGRIKPDIMAPGGGRMLQEARPKETLFSGTSIGSMLDGFTDKVSDGFTSIAGTSMATPQVAGILAMWKQKIPDLLTEDVKNIFASMGIRQKDPEVGWGLIDATWILSY